MSSIERVRRGTTEEVNVFTGVQHEVVLDENRQELRVQDGDKVGGYTVASELSVVAKLLNVPLDWVGYSNHLNLPMDSLKYLVNQDTGDVWRLPAGIPAGKFFKQLSGNIAVDTELNTYTCLLQPLGKHSGYLTFDEMSLHVNNMPGSNVPGTTGWDVGYSVIGLNHHVYELLDNSSGILNPEDPSHVYDSNGVSSQWLDITLKTAGSGTQGAQGPTGPKGDDGIDGQDGTNGTNGTDGADGTDGVSFTISGQLAWGQIEVLTSPNTGETYQLNSTTGNTTPPTRHNGSPAQVNDLVHWNGSLWINLGAIQGAQGATGAQGAAGTNGTNGADGQDGTNGVDGADGTFDDTRAYMFADSSGGDTNSGTINWGNIRAIKDTVDGLAFPVLTWSLGRSFTAINGIFRVRATVEFNNPQNGDTNLLELLGTQDTTNNTPLVIRDYVEVSNGSIDKAILTVEATLIGDFDGSTGTTETIQFDVNHSGDSGSVMDIVAGSTQISITRVGDAPSSFVPYQNNAANLANE